MYRVDVDLVLRFVPPMGDNGQGIRLTRTIELPFPPVEDVAVFSKEWEGIDDPMGYRLKEITWDIDRECFLADTTISITGIPIAFIPREIRMLLDRGWRYGSYSTQYQAERHRGLKRTKLRLIRTKKWDEEEAETWETLPNKARPKEFKTILHAILATMAELHNNERVAYAMMRTDGYVDIADDAPVDKLSPFEKKFAKAMKEFDAMTPDDQWKWCENVQRRCPRLIDVVEATR